MVRLFVSLVIGFAFFGFLALAVDHSLGSGGSSAKAPVPKPVLVSRPVSTPTPPVFSAVKLPPNACELFAGAITFPPGVPSDTGQAIVLGVLMGTAETRFVWDVPPAQRERLEDLLNQCLVLERGVDMRIDWP